MNWQGNTPFPILKPARFINRDRFLSATVKTYAWLPIKDMVNKLAKGELLQPRGTWMLDDDKGIFACVDGLRPVIMLIEAIEESQK